MSLVLCKCGAIQNNRIRQSDYCFVCKRNDWVEAPDNLEAMYWKQEYNSMAEIASNQQLTIQYLEAHQKREE